MEGVAAPNPARAFNSGCPSPEDVSSVGLGWGEGLEENIQEALDRADAAGPLGPPVPSGSGRAGHRLVQAPWGITPIGPVSASAGGFFTPEPPEKPEPTLPGTY